MTVLTCLIAVVALGLVLWDWWTTRDDDADARDPNVVAFKRGYAARASWRNGAPRAIEPGSFEPYSSSDGPPPRSPAA